jgi:Mn2+/Fe2+ NRAMP family transporter
VLIGADTTSWYIGLGLGAVVVVVAVMIVATILVLANRIAGQAETANDAVEAIRRQTGELGGVAEINDSGVRILHAARALRKAAVGH